jgi:hypothetical protein
MRSVDELRSKIAGAITRGEDTAELERELRVALMERQADELARGEVAKAQELAKQHQAWQAKAAEIVAEVEKQNGGVKKILDAQGSVVKDVRQLLEKLKDLQPAGKDAFGGRFHYPHEFQGEAKAIPAKYFPPGFELKYIYRRDAVPTFNDDPLGSAMFRLDEVLAIFQGLHEVKIGLPEKWQPADTGLADDALTADQGPACSICSHPDRAAIDQAIRAGTSLRDIEKAHPGTSRSSLSRHKAHLGNIS